MAEPFLAEIRIMSFGFAPKGWALANGQILPISQNQALFSLLGTTFGGDGSTTYALPDLRGRTPIHDGSGHTLGERAGEQAHTLSTSELPQHVHGANVSSTATGGSASPVGRFLGAANNAYHAADGATQTTLRPDTITNVGGGQAHENMQPFLTLSFCIALDGIYPSAN
jgi:microcystin-dependent protein